MSDKQQPPENVELDEIDLEAAVGGVTVRPCIKALEPCLKNINPCVKVRPIGG